MRDKPSLYIELRNTDLEDFAQHMMVEIFVLAALLEPSFSDLDSEGPKWVVDTPMRDADIAWTRMNDSKGRKILLWSLKAKNGNNYGFINVIQRGMTEHEWSVYFSSTQEKRDFWLIATHYQRDRLNIVMWEDLDVEPMIGDYLLNWIKQFWGKGEVVPLNPEDAPPAPSAAPSENRPAAYGDKPVRSTLVHYLVTKHQKSPTVACGLVGDISENTYRRHRDGNLLLSDHEFERVWDASLEDAAQELLNQ